jgi:AAA15 family ATPase/GTPase
MKIKFTIVEGHDLITLQASHSYLIFDNWNDFGYQTLFRLMYVDKHLVRHDIGSLKIGFFEHNVDSYTPKLEKTFYKLTSTNFSLGQSDTYYINLNKLGNLIRDEILFALNDIVKNPSLYEKAIQEEVTKVSLLRTISPTSVTGQFRRLVMGGESKRGYKFHFVAPYIEENSSEIHLSFDVVPESFPPTNIHVLIGRNGVGKTNLVNNMINSLVDNKSYKRRYGSFYSSTNEQEDNKLFANLISVSFSAFDESDPKPEIKDKTIGISYSYIGLKRVRSSNKSYLSPKSTKILMEEFFTGLDSCKKSAKINRWIKAIEVLESDPNFKETEIRSLLEIKDENYFKDQTSKLFRNLSSGHKIVLLTITRLIETLQEKSLVILDEPEAHLHPPLLSAFIRALSDLLLDTNGVAIIATHSPVILQEVPKSCVWKLRRVGSEAIAERLEIESFGENVGVLTNEVFGLEVTSSGYYKLLSEVVEKKQSYEAVLSHFNNQLGMEARAIAMSLIATKKG